MTRRIISISIIYLLFTITSNAQDPMKVAPQAYKLEFEDEWVKVVRVNYGPRENIPKRTIIRKRERKADLSFVGRAVSVIPRSPACPGRVKTRSGLHAGR